MKQLLYILFTSMTCILSAQTTETISIDWFTGVGNDVDRTIETGDTVTWVWKVQITQ